MSLAAYAAYLGHEKNLMLDWGTLRMDRILLEQAHDLSVLERELLAAWVGYYKNQSALVQKDMDATSKEEVAEALGAENQQISKLCERLQAKAESLPRSDAHAKAHLRALADTLTTERESNEEIIAAVMGD